MHERRLTRTARAHDGGELATLEEHVDSVERANLTVAGAVDLRCTHSVGGLTRIRGRDGRRGE